MHECWAWVDPLNNEQYEWVRGWECGTTVLPYKGHINVFRPLNTAHEKDYSAGYYVEDWQLCYGVEKPTHTAEEFEFINQVIKAL